MTQAFNLSQLANKVNTSGQLDAATGLNGISSVANGGTGKSSIATNNVILGNGTSPVQEIAPGTSGNVLQSNGTTWQSVASNSYGGLTTVIFNTSGTWAVPAGVVRARITVIGGGGGGRTGASSAFGGYGGIAVGQVSGLSGSVSITVGVGGNGGSGTNGAGGGSSAFGSAISATGGTGATASVDGTNGTGTVASGTAFVTGGNSTESIIYFIVDGTSSGSNSGVVWSAGKRAGSGGYSTSGESGGIGGVVVIEY